ncbi:hypothetical protein ABIE27_004878 [Paenibacillus sp. 4624]|jgi:hypothetical protein|uniref:Uncharacterized protein n=1 Tax=Paenibacillus amylolyticus TaxID=1451 RepID=A0A5M9WTH8_PAEAM|nr:hypothetical protein [Paenibacillus amylolyticus]KAA8784944.1 hypothetical protein EC604_13910 [Paenibacillus amylolyticus]
MEKEEELLLVVRLMVGGGLLFLSRGIYQLYGHDLLNRTFMEIVFIFMFVVMMRLFRKLSLFQLALDVLRDVYRLYRKSRNSD